MGRYVGLMCLTILLRPLLLGQWMTNGVPVCDTAANLSFYMLPQIASDGVGGAFVCWRDARNGSDYDIYSQHIASNGTMLWRGNGIPIVNSPGDQQYPRIVSDTKGGFFIAWEDSRSGVNVFIYVQHVDKDGHMAWQDGGIKAAESPGMYISLAADRSGGLIMAWNGPNINNVLLQRLDSTGARVWGDSGVRISDGVGPINANDLVVICDGVGGAIVTWSQGNYKQEQVFAQHIDSSGNPSWGTNGLPVSDNMHNTDVSLSPDLQGGGIISWSAGDTLKFAQRIDGSGRLLWGYPGINLGIVVGGGLRRHTADLKGGAYVGHARFVQHVDSNGVQLWGGQGGQFTSSSTLFWNSSQARNETRGIWNFWTYESDSTNSSDIYGQYFNADGTPLWGALGKPVCSAASIQDWANATSDDRGSAIIVWDDFRNGHSSVYGAKVDTTMIVTSIQNVGQLHQDIPTLQQNYPNPFNPETTITFWLPKRSSVRLGVYNLLGEKVIDIVNGIREAGINRVILDANNLASGIYLYHLDAGLYHDTKKMVVLH